jgi:hypothetical protein
MYQQLLHSARSPIWWAQVLLPASVRDTQQHQPSCSTACTRQGCLHKVVFWLLFSSDVLTRTQTTCQTAMLRSTRPSHYTK